MYDGSQTKRDGREDAFLRKGKSDQDTSRKNPETVFRKP
jgi:hypothetical protein